MILSEISVRRPSSGGAPFLFPRTIVIARLVQGLIAFARNSADHKITGAPHGALFNAYAFV
jgi:hypothetical protein